MQLHDGFMRMVEKTMVVDDTGGMRRWSDPEGITWYSPGLQSWVKKFQQAWSRRDYLWSHHR